MARDFATISHGSGGVRIQINGGGVRVWSNIEGLAEAHAQAMVTEDVRRRQEDGIRRVMNDHEKMDSLTKDNLIAAIRTILDEDVPF